MSSKVLGAAKRETARMWDMKTVQVIPIVLGSLGSVTKNLDKWLEKFDKRISISLFKKLRYWKLNSKDFKESFGVTWERR